MLDFYGGGKLRVNFIGGYLNKTNKTAYAYGKLVNIYTVFQLEASSFNINDSTLKTCLFGTVTLTKNADINKYGYSGYGIGFDRRWSYSFPGGGFGQNVLKGLTQGLEHTLPAEKMYSINFTVSNKKFCWSLHYNGANSYIFVNDTKFYKFKTKDSEIVSRRPICLGNISKNWSIDNMKKTEFSGHVYDFSVGYDAIDVDGIKNINKYLMKKNDIVYKYIKRNIKCFYILLLIM